MALLAKMNVKSFQKSELALLPQTNSKILSVLRKGCCTYCSTAPELHAVVPVLGLWLLVLQTDLKHHSKLILHMKYTASVTNPSFL